jgi:hypothetical protein
MIVEIPTAVQPKIEALFIAGLLRNFDFVAYGPKEAHGMQYSFSKQPPVSLRRSIAAVILLSLHDE